MSAGKTTGNGQTINSPAVQEAVVITPVTDLKGLFGKPATAVTIDDMNSAIAKKGGDAK